MSVLNRDIIGGSITGTTVIFPVEDNDIIPLRDDYYIIRTEDQDTSVISEYIDYGAEINIRLTSELIKCSLDGIFKDDTFMALKVVDRIQNI